jgi:hypothetical protein
LAGIREHVAAQRFNSCVTIINRHLVEEYPEDSLQAANRDLVEAADNNNNAPFLSTSDDIEEFFDAAMDQFSESSGVGLFLVIMRQSFKILCKQDQFLLYVCIFWSTEKIKA